jgi:hypothetical protein
VVTWPASRPGRSHCSGPHTGASGRDAHGGRLRHRPPAVDLRRSPPDRPECRAQRYPSWYRLCRSAAGWVRVLPCPSPRGSRRDPGIGFSNASRAVTVMVLVTRARRWPRSGRGIRDDQARRRAHRARGPGRGEDHRAAAHLKAGQGRLQGVGPDLAPAIQPPTVATTVAAGDRRFPGRPCQPARRHLERDRNSRPAGLPSASRTRTAACCRDRRGPTTRTRRRRRRTRSTRARPRPPPRGGRRGEARRPRR